MGKIFLEKVLRSTEVKRIYLLLRRKKGIEPKERVLKIFEDPVSKIKVMKKYFKKNNEINKFLSSFLIS